MGFAAGLQAGSQTIERGLRMRQIWEDRKKQAEYEKALKEFEENAAIKDPPKQNPADPVQQSQGLSFAQKVGAGLDGTAQPVQAQASPAQAAMPQPSDGGLAQMPQKPQRGMDDFERLKALRSIAIMNGRTEDALKFDSQMRKIADQQMRREELEGLSSYRERDIRLRERGANRAGEIHQFNVSQAQLQQEESERLRAQQERADRVSSTLVAAAAGELENGYTGGYNALLEGVDPKSKEAKLLKRDYILGLSEQTGVPIGELGKFGQKSVQPVVQFMRQEFASPQEELAAANQLLAEKFDPDITDGIPVVIRPTANGGVAVWEGDRVVTEAGSPKELAAMYKSQYDADPWGSTVYAFQNNQKAVQAEQRRFDRMVEMSKLEGPQRKALLDYIKDLRDPTKNPGNATWTPGEWKDKYAEGFRILNLPVPAEYRGLPGGTGGGGTGGGGTPTPASVGLGDAFDRAEAGAAEQDARTQAVAAATELAYSKLQGLSSLPPEQREQRLELLRQNMSNMDEVGRLGLEAAMRRLNVEGAVTRANNNPYDFNTIR